MGAGYNFHCVGDSNPVGPYLRNADHCSNTGPLVTPASMHLNMICSGHFGGTRFGNGRFAGLADCEANIDSFNALFVTGVTTTTTAAPAAASVRLVSSSGSPTSGSSGMLQ